MTVLMSEKDKNEQRIFASGWKLFNPESMNYAAQIIFSLLPKLESRCPQKRCTFKWECQDQKKACTSISWRLDVMAQWQFKMFCPSQRKSAPQVLEQRKCAHPCMLPHHFEWCYSPPCIINFDDSWECEYSVEFPLPGSYHCPHMCRSDQNKQVPNSSRSTKFTFTSICYQCLQNWLPLPRLDAKAKKQARSVISP